MNKRRKAVDNCGMYALKTLGDDDKKLWRDLEALLPVPLSPADALSFNLLVFKFAEWVKLCDHNIRNGITDVSGRSGIEHLTPQARREAEVFGELLKLCKEFGLTPFSRRRGGGIGASVQASSPASFVGGCISDDPGRPMK